MSWISVKERFPKPHEFVEVSMQDFSYQMFKLKPQWCTRLANGVIAKSRIKTDGSIEIYTIEE